MCPPNRYNIGKKKRALSRARALALQPAEAGFEGDEPGAERGSVARAAAASAEHRHLLFVEHDHARVHFVGSVLRICHMRAPIQARHASARRTHVFEAAARTCSVARWLLDDTSALSWSVTASRAVHLQRCGSSRDARIAIVASIVWNASPTAKPAQLSHLNSNLRVVAGSFRAAPQGN